MAYKGKRPRGGGLFAERAILLAVIVLAAIIALTIRANSQWTGMSAGEQLKQAVFEAKDWD